MLSLLVLAAAAHATGVSASGASAADASALSAAPTDLPATFQDTADAYGVPEKLLLALSYEASRWRVDAASAWGGYGLFDLREDVDGPNVEQAAILADLDPDDVIEDPAANVEAAAALLAWHARAQNGGSLPDRADLLAWWSAVRAFSGAHDPVLQDRYAGSIYETINFGVELDPASGLEIAPEPVDHWGRVATPPPTSCDYAGCAQFVSASSSNYTNQSRTASDISTIVVHTVQGSYSGCISWFQNSSASVSAHYVVRSSDGEVTQMVLEEDKAWHVGSENGYTVGIEHEGYIDQPSTYYTEAMYQASAMLTADIADRNNIPISRSYIVGHVELPNQTHTDPGSGWDWSHYMDLVNQYASGGSATGNLIGVVADGDIYSGARLAGATVWIEETGEEGVSESDGYYRFYDLALDTYTVHACMDGYAEATCTKSVSTGDNWCSIALQPGDGSCSLYGTGDDGGGDDGGGDDGGGDGGGDGAVDTGGTGTVDTGGGDGGGDGTIGDEPEPGPSPNIPTGGAPGDRVHLDHTGGCSHTGPRGLVGGLVLVWVALFALVRAREE